QRSRQEFAPQRGYLFAGRARRVRTAHTGAHGTAGSGAFRGHDMNARDDQAVPVMLVLMPYADIARPSIALGTLKACLNEAGIGCSVEYADLRFAGKLGGGMPEGPFLAGVLGGWAFW